jgi:thiamine biosynthesis lipoprotein
MQAAAEVAPAAVQREARAMGSPLRLQVVSPVPARLVDAAWAEVIAEFEASEQALSRFRDDSEVHRLRLAGGVAASPSRRLVAALTAAARANRVTDGRFDPRVLAVLERLGSRPLGLTATLDDRAAGRRSDPSQSIFSREGRHGTLRVPAPVDFGGIGKGLALRWAARRAARVLGAEAFLIEAGGDIVACGAPAGHGWRIGIEAPSGTSSGSSSGPLAVIELPPTGGAVATSSVRIGRWQAADGSLVHHLIDPLTGAPGGSGLQAVTVVGADPAWAEVWSKALFLEGAAGIAAAARARGLAAWWVTDEGLVEMTPAARPRTVWLEAEAA